VEKDGWPISLKEHLKTHLGNLCGCYRFNVSCRHLCSAKLMRPIYHSVLLATTYPHPGESLLYRRLTLFAITNVNRNTVPRSCGTLGGFKVRGAIQLLELSESPSCKVWPVRFLFTQEQYSLSKVVPVFESIHDVPWK
jgi:hypothetical protein